MLRSDVPIREFFHLIHVVDDFDAGATLYAELLAPLVFYPKSYSDDERRWASLGLVGTDFVIEVVEPGDREEDLERPLPRFRRRFGEHFHSLGWYVDGDDLPPLVRRLCGYGVRVVGPEGQSLCGVADADLPRTVFTHPKDTSGQVELQGVLPSDDRPDPRFRGDWSSTFWRDRHPLGIERTSHLTTVVRSIDESCRIYEAAFGARPFHRREDGDSRSAFLLMGLDTVVEFAQPLVSGTLLADDLAEHGQLPHSVTFRVRDLEAVERHVEAVGIRVGDRRADTLTLDPRDCHYAVFSFTTQSLPDDPRDRRDDNEPT